MKRFALVIVGLAFAASSAQAIVYEYDGSLALVSSTGQPCDDAFSVTKYRSKAAVTGTTGRIVIINFQDTTGAGFLHNISFTSLLAADNDYAAKKSATVKEVAWDMTVEGAIGRDFHIAKIGLTASKDGKVLCTGSAEYSGFR